MNSRKKWWLIARAALIVLFLISVISSPSKNSTQLFVRTIMLAVLGITFLIDLYQYRKDKNR